MRQALAARVPTSSLDDHRRWVERMRTMAGTAVAIGVAVLGAGLGSDGVFGHLCHARNHDDQSSNRRSAALCGRRPTAWYRGSFSAISCSWLQGAAPSVAAAAILLFAVVEAANTWFVGTPGGDEIAGLFGNLSIGVAGYLAILLQIVFMALATAFASRRSVNRTLETMD